MGRSILIAGGGIGGLVAALCLNRAGHDVTVFETVSEPRELGVGINLLPHSVRVLHDLGLESDLAASAVATSELRFCSDDGVLIWSEPRGLAAGSVPKVQLRQFRLSLVRQGGNKPVHREDDELPPRPDSEIA